MRSLDRPRSLRELALTSGTTQSRVRAAVQDGLIRPSELSWSDVVAIRSFIPAQSIVLAGEAVPRNYSRQVTARSWSAVEAVQTALTADALGPHAVLAVGRTSASVHPTLELATGQGADLHADGALLILPVGQLWSELRWRAGR